MAAAAVEQCHRARLPEVTGPHDWSDLPGLAARGGGRGSSTRHRTARPLCREPRPTSGALLVGPEGGWSPDERAELLAAGWRAAGLGDRVLRVETAAVAGAAMLLLAGG